MRSANTPRPDGPVALFDLNGTLTDTGPIGEPWGRPDLGEAVMRDAQACAMADALLGRRRSSVELVRSALGALVIEERLDDARMDVALSHVPRFPARHGARRAIETLTVAGFRVAVLGNADQSVLDETLRANGVANAISLGIGADRAGAYMPVPRAYRHALDELAATPDQVVMITTRPTTLTGAAACGLRTLWVTHGRRAYPSADAVPDLRADDLGEAVTRLIAAATDRLRRRPGRQPGAAV